MNRIIYMLFIFLPLLAYSQENSSTVRKIGENIHISSRIDQHHEINYWFKKCMANDLFTFYRVSILSDSVNIIIANEAHYSDNIGPFYIKDGGWCGGNHLFTDEQTKTAETFSVKLYADDHRITSDTTLVAQKIEFEVKNHIFNPVSAKTQKGIVSFTDTLCIENVIYTIIGNSIQVDLSHDYINKMPVRILRYYGMQSMFNDERYLLTPSGKYLHWTEINNVDRFKKKDFPRFNRYIEKSDSCFQASFLLNRGLGAHNELSGDDIIFIGNSWTKCYHKLIGNTYRFMGNHDSWSGVYTWFTKARLDTRHAFAYDGFIDGKKVIFFSNNANGNFSISIPENSKNKKMNIIDNTSGTKFRIMNDSIYFHCRFPGSTIITFDK